MTERTEQSGQVEQATEMMVAREPIDDAAARQAVSIAGQLKTALGFRLNPGPQADAGLASAMEVVADIGPVNALEGMLATQMVATQNLVLNCLGNAAAADNARLFETTATTGAKLMRMFAQQVDTLQRLRGKQRSTMRVEHVQVAADSETKVTRELERTR